jgi:hypothetical protein
MAGASKQNAVPRDGVHRCIQGHERRWFYARAPVVKPGTSRGAGVAKATVDVHAPAAPPAANRRR